MFQRTITANGGSAISVKKVVAGVVEGSSADNNTTSIETPFIPKYITIVRTTKTAQNIQYDGNVSTTQYLEANQWKDIGSSTNTYSLVSATQTYSGQQGFCFKNGGTSNFVWSYMACTDE